MPFRRPILFMFLLLAGGCAHRPVENIPHYPLMDPASSLQQIALAHAEAQEPSRQFRPYRCFAHLQPFIPIFSAH